MTWLKQFAIILAVTVLGELLHYLIPAPVPASIYGLVILFVCLQTGVVKVSQIREVSSFLIGIMPLLFVPAAAGLLLVWPAIRQDVVAYLVILVTTTVLVMAAAGRVTQALLRKGGRQDG